MTNKDKPQKRRVLGCFVSLVSITLATAISGWLAYTVYGFLALDYELAGDVSDTPAYIAIGVFVVLWVLIRFLLGRLFKRFI